MLTESPPEAKMNNKTAKFTSLERLSDALTPEESSGPFV